MRRTVRDARFTVVLFLAAALVLIGWLGAYGLWDQDEGRHAAIARELYAATSWRGWIIPSHNFTDYHDKPILYYWLTSIAYLAVGVSELGARLVSALSALATLSAVYLWTATVTDVPTARRAVVVLATSLGFVALGRYGSLDMLLTCWITIGVLAAERSLADRTRRGWALLAAAAAGLGMLTKGLVAPLFVAGVPIVHAFLGRTNRPSARGLVLAIAIFLLVAAPWYVAAELLDPGYLREFVLQHHVARFASDDTSFHPGPWWYYGPALLLLCFPWSFLFPATLVATIRRRDPALRYCLCWAALVVVFFSCSGGKLATYVLPAVPPLAIVTAHAIPFGATGRRLAAAGLVALVVALLAAVPIAFRIDRAPWDELVAAGWGYLLLFPATAAVVLVAWRRRGLTAATNALATCTAAGLLVFYAGAAPLVSQVTSARRMADVITAHADAPIVSYGVTPASLLFYVGRPVVRLDRPRALLRLLEEEPFAWIVTSPRHVDAIARTVPVYPWVTSGRRVLYATAPPRAVASLRTGQTAD